MHSRIRPSANSTTLKHELEWLSAAVRARLSQHLSDESAQDALDVPAPPLDGDDSLFASFVQHYEMDNAERLTLLLALAPHVRPQLLDVFFGTNEQLGRGYTEFGGVQGKVHGGFLPTGETALFLVAGSDLRLRLDATRLFDRDHFFARHNILKLDSPPAGEPLMSGQLLLSDEIVDFLTTGEPRKPDYSRDFPAKLITTEMDWEDLVLAPTTREQIRELEAWTRHEPVLMNEWDLRRRLKPGYRCLFYGPPGTGKTLTATLIGKHVDKDVYRIELSAVSSKYIGESQKALERIFERVEHMDCILFFDEADALFGKRTSIGDAHDRYANQEVSYLLQRIEDFPGLAILATNYIGNIDEAFMRRFQAVVHFPMPNNSERKRLWTASFSKHTVIDEGVTLDEIAREYEISGAAIMNAVRYSSLMALEANSNVIRRADLIDGIRRELQKDGKTL